MSLAMDATKSPIQISSLFNREHFAIFIHESLALPVCHFSLSTVTIKNSSYSPLTTIHKPISYPHPPPSSLSTPAPSSRPSPLPA